MKRACKNIHTQEDDDMRVPSDLNLKLYTDE
jgi:hypothetical protein